MFLNTLKNRYINSLVKINKNRLILLCKYFVFLINILVLFCVLFIRIFSHGGGDGDEIYGNIRFSIFLGSKSKFLLAKIEFFIYFSF